MLVRCLVRIAILAGTGSAHAAPYHCKPTASPARTYDTGLAVQQELVPIETPCVDGEVIAIVSAYEGRIAPLESSYARPFHRPGNAVYAMTLPGSYAQLVYFPLAGGDLTAVNDGEGKRYETDVEIIAPSTKQKVGLARDAHLVRMEINGGRGSASTEHRVIGKVLEILDGTKAYPLDVSAVLHNTLADFEKPSTKRGARWRSQARKVVTAAIKADKTRNLSGYNRSETLYAGYLARWSTDTNTMHVTFYGALTKSFSRTFKTGPRQANMRGPHPPSVNIQVEYPTEYAVDFEVDVNGKVISEKEYPAVATDPRSEEFPEY